MKKQSFGNEVTANVFRRSISQTGFSLTMTPNGWGADGHVNERIQSNFGPQSAGRSLPPNCENTTLKG